MLLLLFSFRLFILFGVCYKTSCICAAAAADQYVGFCNVHFNHIQALLLLLCFLFPLMSMYSTMEGKTKYCFGFALRLCLHLYIFLCFDLLIFVFFVLISVVAVIVTFTVAEEKMKGNNQQSCHGIILIENENPN